MKSTTDKLTATEKAGCGFRNLASNPFGQAFDEAWKPGARGCLWVPGDPHGKPEFG